MSIDSRLRCVALFAALAMSAGCVSNTIFEAEGDTQFGDANRQTMMAQVIDPDPLYDELVPVSSGEHAAEAVERYREGRVREPDTIRTTSGLGGSGGD